MMKKLKLVHRLLVLLVASATIGLSVAQANPVSSDGLIAGALQVKLNSVFNNDERGAASNFIWDVYVGRKATITSLKWDVNVTSFVGSYLSEMQITFSDTVGHGLTFTPGDGDDIDGTMAYSGFQDFGATGQIVQVGGDGILRLEFHDGYKDLAFDEAEGTWNFGTLTFGIGVAEVPEPPTPVLMLGSLLLLSSALKRRRSNGAVSNSILTGA